MKKILSIIFLSLIIFISSCSEKTAARSYTRFITENINTEIENDYEYYSLIRDKKFKRGFNLQGLGYPIYGDEIELYPGLNFRDTGIDFDYNIEQDNEPIWDLAQSATRYPFHDINNIMDPLDYKFVDYGNNKYSYINRSKIVEVNTKTSEFRLYLKGSECYKEPRVYGQEWPHLLFVQDFNTPRNVQEYMCVSNMSNLTFHIECKMNSFVDYMGELADPSIHSAICMFYIFVSYLPEGSMAYTDMLNLGIQLFDNRSAYPAGMSAIDSLDSKPSATGSWIYNINSWFYLSYKNNFYDQSGNLVYDKWITIDFDCLPFIKTALKDAKNGGTMKTATYDRLYISGMYIGYELPGTYDLDMSFKNMDLISVIEVK